MGGNHSAILAFPLWVVLLIAFAIGSQTQIDWVERGGLIVGIFSVLYAFMKLDLNRVLLELVKRKAIKKQVVFCYHATHFWGLALCCIAYFNQVLSLNVEETLLLLPWLLVGFIVACYQPKLLTRWPLKVYQPLYQQVIVLPFLAIIASFILCTLPIFEVSIADVIWLPILNPLELTSMASMLFVVHCLRHKNAQVVLTNYFKIQLGKTKLVSIWVAFSGVIFAHSALGRGVSHYTLASYDLFSLWHSGVFQAGLAILWSVIAMMATGIGSRFGSVRIWWVGAILFAVTVLKLLVLDLSNRDTIVMVFAIIFVGVVMVLVGYFSPMPKSRKSLE
ncbi:DUF2339 domain-containing protein [Vibrio algarum]|uniref:DUF2339 domain-containing protein n=1 Tax=Vibrio algarum TaxID=3020714 RepID=A0ABT4YSP1_9VIBR|nr:DUF2339 domain-containing protein [Vibrio sp. KJ40-1]MDB1124079.1 DUF2339 domain-containing protein [Vibrio sp. KJ40-1]